MEVQRGTGIAGPLRPHRHSLGICCPRTIRPATGYQEWFPKLAAFDLRWSANPHVGDNKALVHKGVVILGVEESEHIVEPWLACLA